MRWLFFAVFAYLFLAVGQGAEALLHLPVTTPAVSPDFVLILAAFIGLWASPNAVLWGCCLLGVLVDLSKPVPVGASTTLALLGPATLGYLFGGYAMLQIRGLLHRTSPLAVAVMSLAGGVFIHLGAVAILSMRSATWLFNQPIVGWDAADELIHRFFILLYTAVAAVPIAWLLAYTQPLWGFDPPRSGYAPRR